MAQAQRARIVLLIDSLGMGGAERLLVTYLQHFDTARFEPRVCALHVRDGNPIANDIRKMGIPVDLVPLRHLREVSGLPRLVQYLRRQRADLLHTQLEFADTVGNVAARIAGIPTVSTQHTFENPGRGSRAFWRHRLMWWSLRHYCDRIVAVSEAGRRHHIRLGRLAPDKVVTIHGGIDLSPFRDGAEAERRAGREALGVPADAPLLITVAVLRREKGIQHMIEALPQVLQAVPEARYLVVGDGEHRAALEELAGRLGVADRVIFTGLRKDIPDLLAVSDLFVLPTLGDVLPTVLSEAMAARKPIVASRVGGVPEMVEEGRNGLLVEPGDPGQLAAACLRLLRDRPAAQEMGRAGWEIAAERFNVRRQVQRLGDLYQELLSGNGRYRN